MHEIWIINTRHGLTADFGKYSRLKNGLQARFAIGVMSAKLDDRNYHG